MSVSDLESTVTKRKSKRLGLWAHLNK